jgi:methylglutaconyl-CoA hydratase
MSTIFQTIVADIAHGILTIKLNRPDTRNSLNDVMVKELLEIFSAYKGSSEVKVVILTGNGSSFCAGADLKYLDSLPGNDLNGHLKDSVQLRDMFRELFLFPKPTIAMVNGPAIGGGCGLVNVCDFAIASNDAKFGYPEVKIGFVPAIVSVFLVASIGIHKAKDLLLTGRIIGPEEARSFNLVNIVVPDQDNLERKVRETAEALKINAPSSLAFTKNFLNQIVMDDLETHLSDAAALNAESRLHENFREGLLSFIEKRKPDWR